MVPYGKCCASECPPTNIPLLAFPLGFHEVEPTFYEILIGNWIVIRFSYGYEKRFLPTNGILYSH